MRTTGRPRCYGQPAEQSGMTLIELLIAMLINGFLMIGTITIFVQSRADFRVSDSVARLQENVRFAMDIIEPDVRLAKFWGRSSETGLIAAVPGGVNVICDTDGGNYTAWALNFGQELSVVDETSGYNHAALGIPCPAATTAQPDSDAFVLRHVSGQPTLPTGGVIQAQTDLNRTDVFNTGIVPAGYGLFAQTHDVVVNVYYVDSGSDLDATLPSLRLKTLVNGVLQDQELISGVENLQVQLGVDTDVDGDVDRYVDANHPIVDPTSVGFLPTAEVIAARLWMLMRTERQETGFTDDTLGYITPDPDVVVAPCWPVSAACFYPDRNRRLVTSTTISLRNNR